MQVTTTAHSQFLLTSVVSLGFLFAECERIKTYLKRCVNVHWYIFIQGTKITYNNYLITESEVVTGKSQTEALPY